MTASSLPFCQEPSKRRHRALNDERRLSLAFPHRYTRPPDFGCSVLRIEDELTVCEPEPKRPIVEVIPSFPVVVKPELGGKL